MTNSRAAKASSLIHLETYTAGSAESSKVFTITSEDFDGAASLILYIDYTATLAMTLEMKINALTAGYAMDGTSTTAGTATVIDTSSTSEWDIGPVGIGSGANAGGHLKIELFLQKAGSLDYPTINVTGYASSGNLAIQQGGMVASGVSAITSITIETDTSSWQTGARMSLYKLKRS